MSDVHVKIAELVNAHPVVLFMKGSRRFPQCGFSQRVVSILDQHLPKYETVNVLQDPAIRDGIKAFSQWPTIPQLYVKGKFVGGCDIVTEMAQSGELKDVLGDLASSAAAPAKASAPPAIKVTDAAARALKDAAESDADMPRLVIDPRFQYELYFDEKKADDFVVSAGAVSILVDRDSASRAQGMTIDFATGEGGGGFKMENPNEPPRVRALSVTELKAMRDRGDALELVDTRTPREREIARIDGDRFLDEAGLAHLEKLSKDTPIAFYCHHGGRSRSVAERFVQLGFTKVFNVEGGVDAWARTIDTNVKTY